ncbi:hypothetical protein FB451DRAFT_1177091 [Mycena latifolia]|nr:hypothetical protein FB451DRAFT_1177091 [Mycena latifolia]
MLTPCIKISEINHKFQWYQGEFKLDSNQYLLREIKDSRLITLLLPTSPLRGHLRPSREPIGMVFKRKRDDSDYDADFSPPVRLRKWTSVTVERALSLPPSSPPAPATPDGIFNTEPHTPDSEEPLEPFGPLPALFPSLSPNAGPSRAPQMPQHQAPRAHSEEPRGSSPLSVLDVTPLKPRRGRPVYTPETRNLKQIMRTFSSSDRTPNKQKFREAA